jgi:hypothetical protein
MTPLENGVHRASRVDPHTSITYCPLYAVEAEESSKEIRLVQDREISPETNQGK